MHFYKVSLSSLLVALVAIQQSYAIQSLSQEQWESVFCKAYQCSLLQESGTLSEEEAREAYPETCHEPGSRYTAISLKPRKEFGFYSDIQSTLQNIYTPVNAGYAHLILATAEDDERYARRRSTNAFPHNTDCREVIYSKNLQLKE